ncbi:MAG: DUF3277 family protein [Eubacterium sp.]|nr:DUF3277 family protein [Eubacterium sp.]
MANPASYTTYAFEDVDCVVSHPSVGSYSFNGAGTGSITIVKANDMSSHDLAADGSVMTSKIKAGNGTATIAVQQTSPGAEFLRKLNSYCDTAHSSEFTRTIISVVSKEQGVNITCTGVSPQKSPDTSFQQAGQQVSFAYLAQRITGM